MTVAGDHVVEGGGEAVDRRDEHELPDPSPETSDLLESPSRSLVSAMRSASVVDPESGLGDLLAREPRSVEILDELPRLRSGSGRKATLHPTRDRGAERAVPVEDQDAS